jgi:hypothetical protein
MIHYPDDISLNKLNENLSNVIHLSGRFVYPDDFAGNQSVRINEARLYIYVLVISNLMRPKRKTLRYARIQDIEDEILKN